MRPELHTIALAAVSIALIGCGSATTVATHPELRPVVPAPPLRPIAGRPVGPQRADRAWTRKLEGAVVPGPTEGPDGTVYAASNGGVLHAIDPSTGGDRWTFDGGSTYGIDLSTSATVVGTTVLWPGPDNALFALDARSGHLIDRAQLGGQANTPAVRDDSVFVQDSSGALTAFALHGLRRRWQVDLGTVSYASPAIGRDGTVYTAADDDLVAVRDGRVAWRVRTRGLVEVSPAVASDGTVTVGSNDHHQYGVSPAGRVRWRYDLGDLTYSSAAVTPDGLIYVGDHRGLVSALDARTGALRYRVLGQGRTADQKSVGVWTRPVVDGHHDVYFGTRPGHLHGFGPTGERLFDVDLGATVDSYPLLTSRGLLIVGSESGVLTALRPPSPSSSPAG